MAASADVQKSRGLRILIEKHGIVFRGVQNRSKWPQAHASLFQKIFDADRLWYADYLQSDRLQPEQKEFHRKHIDQVVRAANSCRQDLDIESTWRMRIERFIRDRFESETNCAECSKTTTLQPGARYLAEHAFGPDEFASRPRIRRRCTCDIAANFADSFDTSDVNIFNIKADPKMQYFDHDRLRKNGVPDTKPDCLIGLAMTKSMRQCVENRTDLIHHPLRNHRQLVYPFLLIEAKSEKGSPGFESIEAQSAFPIMTMLQHQAQLESSANPRVSPLVWFIAYAGCDIRLYGCTKPANNFEVFELWHGSICYHDKVFRLFYILDLLCDWARGYRRAVQTSLVSDINRLRQWTPASTINSSQDAHDETFVFQEEVMANTDVADQSLEERDVMTSSPSHCSVIDLTDSQSEGGSDDEPERDDFIEHRQSFDDSVGRVRSAAFRHIDTVKYQFQHHITSDSDDWGLSIEESKRLRQMVQYALTEGSFLSLFRHSVRKIEATWLGGDHCHAFNEENVEELCIFKLETFFDQEDLLPVRSLSCISMSRRLLDTMLKDQPISIPLPTANRTSDDEAVQQILDFTAFSRSWTRRDLIYSCLRETVHHFVPGQASLHDERRRSENTFGDFNGMKGSLFSIVMANQASQITCHSKIRTLFPGQSQAPMSAPKSFASRECVIIGKSKSAFAHCPDIAVLVPSDDVYDSSAIRKRLPRLLHATIELQDAYRSKFYGKSPRGVFSALQPSAGTLRVAKSLESYITQHVQKTSGI